MNSSTLRVENLPPQPGAAPRYSVTLFEGSPWNLSLEVAKAERAALPGLDFKRSVLERTANPEELGKTLGDFLFAAPIGPQLQSVQSRTYLDVRPPELKDFPWEFARFEDVPLFHDQDRPFSVLRPGQPLHHNPEWGIRVLAVIAAQDDNDAIEVWRELYAIRNAIREANRIIDLKQLFYPSRAKLQTEVDQYRPHVLHLIGHGDNNGLLLFDGTSYKPWTHVQVRTDVGAWSWKPELVYLNTCRSIGAIGLDPAGQASQYTVVDRFLEKGVAAVISMQADVQGDLAGVCAGQFYKRIALGDGVDSALARGRILIAQTVDGGEASIDSYLSKLVVAAPIENILRYQAQVDLPDCPEIKDSLAKFVDREEQRRELVRLLETSRPVVLIQGPPDVGKTWLLQWCIDAWRRRKMDIRYVPISGCHTWLEVVRAIRDGNSVYANNPACVTRGLAAPQRAALNWRLNSLARGIPDPPLAHFTGNEVEDCEQTKHLVDPPLAVIDPHIRSMAALHAALQEEARRSAEFAGLPERPLVIVLDNFVAGDQGLTEMHFGVLQKHWLDAYVAPGTSSIRVVLGLKDDQVKDYNLETLPAGYSEVNLGFFRRENFSDTILDLMPLLHDLGNDQEKALNWVRKQLKIYDPEIGGTRVSGPKLKELCTQIWSFCMSMRNEWANH
jgi:hypothetical protein